MSLQRVSSRPRLVSDTDMAFVNANTIIVEQQEGPSLDDGYDTTTTDYYEENKGNEESGLYGGLFHGKFSPSLPPSTNSRLSSSATAAASNTIPTASIGCNMIESEDAHSHNNNNSSSSNESLEDLFTKQASVSSSSNSSSNSSTSNVDMKTPQHMIENELTIKDLLLKHSAQTAVQEMNSNSTTTKRKRYSIQDDTKEKILMEKMLYHPLSIPPPPSQQHERGGARLTQDVFKERHRGQGVAQQRGKGLVNSSLYPLSMRSPYYHDSLWKSSSTSLASLPLQHQQSLLPTQQSLLLPTPVKSNTISKSKLQSLPSEHLTSIATYLQPIEIHILATTCKSIRLVLLSDSSAKSDVWMKILRKRFGNVFLRIDSVKNDTAVEKKGRVGSIEKEGSQGRSEESREDEGSTTLNMFSWNGSVANELDAQLARMRSTTTTRMSHPLLEAVPTTQQQDVEQNRRKEVSTNEITFVDDYQLPIPGLPQRQEIDESLCYDPYNEYSSNNIKKKEEVNLPLLACLLPTRYPQIIDPRTLQRQQIGRTSDGRMVVQTQTLFRSYLLMIDESNATIASKQQQADNIENEEIVEMADNGKLPLHQDTPSSSTSTQVEVPVIQFIGSVGTGDRCIRLDQPFPPYPKKMDSSHTEKGSNHSVSFGGFSSWMKSHTSVRRRRRERKASRNARSRASRESSEHSSLSAYDHTTNGSMAQQPSTPLVSNLPSTPNRNNQRSPL